MKKEKLEKSLLLKLEKYLGKVDSVTEEVHDGNRKIYVYKCTLCNSKISRHYQRHLCMKHNFKKEDAQLEESRMRVLFLWITAREGESFHRPLPCTICSKWFMRLDNHLRDKHSKRFTVGKPCCGWQFYKEAPKTS